MLTGAVTTAVAWAVSVDVFTPVLTVTVVVVVTTTVVVAASGARTSVAVCVISRVVVIDVVGVVGVVDVAGIAPGITILSPR